MKQVDKQFLNDLLDTISCITFAVTKLEERMDKIKEKGDDLHISKRLKSQTRTFVASINRILKD